MMTYITHNATCSLLSQDCYFPLIHGLSYECKQTKKCVSLLSLLFCTRWFSQFLERRPEIRTAIRITLLLCTQLKNHSTSRESFYGATVPVVCKLSLQRRNLKLSGEWDQYQFIQLYKTGIVRTSKARIARTSKQGSSQLQSRDHQNFEAKIPETSTQESSELQSRVISTSKEGIVRTSKEEIIWTSKARIMWSSGLSVPILKL